MLTTFNKGLRKHEPTSGEPAPFFDSSLQRAYLTDGEVGRGLRTESLEELLGRLIGFGLEPGHDTWPRRLEGIAASAPVARRLGSGTMRGSHLAVSPGVRQTFHEAIEIRIATREHVDAFAGGQSGKMVLDR